TRIHDIGQRGHDHRRVRGAVDEDLRTTVHDQHVSGILAEHRDARIDGERSRDTPRTGGAAIDADVHTTRELIDVAGNETQTRRHAADANGAREYAATQTAERAVFSGTRGAGRSAKHLERPAARPIGGDRLGAREGADIIGRVK